MERFFMTRARAAAYLLRMRRAMRDGIDSLRTGVTDSRLQELDTLDRLLLNVRAGRVREFRLDTPLAVEIMITD
jgi:hypothetical protein